jgi:Bax protein
MSYVRKLLTPITLVAIGAAVVGLYAAALSGDVVAPSIVLPMPEVTAAPVADADAASAERLDAAFGRMGYSLDTVAAGAAEVPPVFLAEVPEDLDELADTQTRKAVFLRVMLPLVLAVDDEVAAERRRLLAIVERKARGGVVGRVDQAFIGGLAARYGTDPDDLRGLLARVDVVPPSLALAQAAAESGWGTSRLVRRDNNLFGQLAAGDQMRAFPSLQDAVRAYVHNLNTHRAYEPLRRARASARTRGEAVDGLALAGALVPYSERGGAYVDQIRSVIRANGLTGLDQARLGAGRAVRPASAANPSI